MSEYQYYEFQAIDRPLDKAAQEALRSVSSRARITSTSFTNHYEWGDFKGDPRELVEQWFDLHLYLANWGTRRLMMKVPKRLLVHADVDIFLRKIDWVDVRTSGDNTIVDIHRDEVETEDEWEDGSGWLAALAPLRADLLSRDVRLFYLLWLMTVQNERVSDEDAEPLPGIGPLTGPLEAFAEFFGIDPDLVQAAAESRADDGPLSGDLLRAAVAAIAEDEKTALLLRLIEGDSHVVADLKGRIRNSRRAAPSAARRTVGELRARAQEIREAKERAAVRRREAAQRRQAEEAEKARQVRLKALKQRGDRVWQEIEEEIKRRNPSSYDKAASLLSDLQALAAEEGSQGEFTLRLASIRKRHENKRNFIERLIKL